MQRCRLDNTKTSSLIYCVDETVASSPLLITLEQMTVSLCLGYDSLVFTARELNHAVYVQGDLVLRVILVTAQGKMI